MKIDEISTAQLPSVFCYDLEFSEIQLDGTKVETVDVDMGVTEASIKSVKRTPGGLSVVIGVILASNDKGAITRTAKAARVNINGTTYPSVPALVSDVMEIRDQETISHSLEQLSQAGR